MSKRKNNVIKLIGDPNMEIKRDDPARRKSFRSKTQLWPNLKEMTRNAYARIQQK